MPFTKEAGHILRIVAKGIILGHCRIMTPHRHKRKSTQRNRPIFFSHEVASLDPSA
jgi:hypothetical protein